MKKIMILIVALFMVSASLYAQEEPKTRSLALIERIKEIQVQTDTATWTPAMNSLCYEKTEDIIKMCGFVPDVTKKFEHPKVSITPYKAKGSVDLTSLFPIVRNQAACGSCWAFAMTGCIEYAQYKNGVVTGWVDLSEQQLVSCCTDCNGCQGGTIAGPANWTIKNGGLVEESVYPYVSGNGTVPACSVPNTTKYKISKCTELGVWIFPASTESMKAVLDQGYPVDTGFYVYEDFKTYESGVYQHTTGELLGGHAVVIVGYEDNHTTPHFIVRNSWWLKDANGNYVKPWGDNGYFRIKYGDSNFGMQASWVK